jgi:transposase-like protein
MLAARGIVVSDETVRQWALKFGQGLLGIHDRFAESHRFCGEPKTLLHEF